MNNITITVNRINVAELCKMMPVGRECGFVHSFMHGRELKCYRICNHIDIEVS